MYSLPLKVEHRGVQNDPCKYTLIMSNPFRPHYVDIDSSFNIIQIIKLQYVYKTHNIILLTFTAYL